MIRDLVIKLAKKYIIKAIEEYIEARKENFAVVLCAIKTWIIRLKIIIDELEKIAERIEDGKIEDKEISDSVDEIKSIVESW